MRNKIKILFGCLIFMALFYESYQYIRYESNSYLTINGGELNQYKSDFVLIINEKKIDTINVNIPSSFSKGINLNMGKNSLILKSLNSNVSFKKEIIFFGIFSWNTIEVTSKDFIYNRYYYGVPILE
jgi:hypothetical protein